MSTPCYTVAQVAELYRLAAAARLENREILDRYSYRELTVICNGIGSGDMPDELRNAISSLNPSLEPVALIHDLECHEARRGGVGEEDFSASNRRFRCNGCRMAEYRYGWYDPRRYYVKSKAKAFAEILQTFGRSAFFGKGGGHAR